MRRGMTLIEIVISMTLFSVAALVAVYTFTSIVQLQQKGATQRMVQQNSRYIIETISREVRDGISVDVQDNGNSLRIVGSDSAESAIHYRYLPQGGGNPAGENIILRQFCNTSGCSEWQRITSEEVRVLPPAEKSVFERVASQASSRAFIRLNLNVAQAVEGLAETDPYAYQYELSTVVNARGASQ